MMTILIPDSFGIGCDHGTALVFLRIDIEAHRVEIRLEVPTCTDRFYASYMYERLKIGNSFININA